jgi:transcriptional regulator with XRE-family HTH domain
MSDTASTEMDGQTIGSRLRSAREHKGLSLEDVARVTRITKGYLAALEEDNYSRLPNDAYAKGFLRVYAQFLGIEEHDVLRLYPHATPFSVPPDESKGNASEHHNAEISQGTKKRMFWSLAVVCALFIVGILCFRFYYGSNLERKAVSPVSIPAVMSPASSSLQPRIADMPEEKTANTSPPEIVETPTVPLVSQEKGIVLKMKALEDGFLVVTIDDMVSQQYDLKAGDVIEWKAERVFSLDLDNAGGVEAELNGKLLKPFGEKGTSAHIMLKADTKGDETAP